MNAVKKYIQRNLYYFGFRVPSTSPFFSPRRDYRLSVAMGF